jgi:hypothetical protein
MCIGRQVLLSRVYLQALLSQAGFPMDTTNEHVTVSVTQVSPVGWCGHVSQGLHASLVLCENGC